MSESLTSEEKDLLDVAHREGAHASAKRCCFCLAPWPCPTVRLLDETRELQVERDEARASRDSHLAAFARVKQYQEKAEAERDRLSSELKTICESFTPKQDHPNPTECAAQIKGEFARLKAERDKYREHYVGAMLDLQHEEARTEAGRGLLERCRVELQMTLCSDQDCKWPHQEQTRLYIRDLDAALGAEKEGDCGSADPFACAGQPRFVCAWCAPEPERTAPGLSHGICPDCAEKMRGEG